MSNRLLQYNGYTFPQTVLPISKAPAADIAEEERPRAPGATSQIARVTALSLVIEGPIGGTGATRDSNRTTIDAIKAACVGVGIRQFFVGSDDRYYNAQLVAWPEDYKGGRFFGLLPTLRLEFRASDPYEYSAAGAVTATTAAAGGTVTVSTGTGDVAPVWTLNVETGAAGTIALTNTTTGEQAVLGGTFTANDVLSLDRNAYAVTWNGAPAFGLLAGKIPRLLAGANTITIACAGGVTIQGSGGSIGPPSVAYTPRWL